MKYFDRYAKIVYSIGEKGVIMERDASVLLNKVAAYNISAVEIVKKAYLYACEKHKNQYRESGEAYITHPLAVATILAEIHADMATICAGLLHDTLEDTKTSEEELLNLFGPEITNLVKGVTNITNMNFYDKTTFNNANLRKVLVGMSKDIRIIIIKLADRIHNMRTLEYKKDIRKQQLKSQETIKIYAPIAEQLGLYGLKLELEDLSFMYLNPDGYKEIRDLRLKWQDASTIKDEIIANISRVLNDNYIFSTIKFRMKNLYGIYKNLMNGTSIDNIHDLFIFNIILDNIDNCYLALKYIHELYKPNPIFFKDYIAQPKPNHYESLHTTVFGPDDKLMQMQIRTPEMEQMARYGITYYWHQDVDYASIIMQDAFNKQYPLMQSILVANKSAKSNADFVQIVEEDVLGEKIPIYNNKGELTEIAQGSTPIDYAYLNFSRVANHLAAVIVNGVAVNFDYVIKPYDKIRIITDINAPGPTKEWLEIAKTATAKQKIKEYLKSKGHGLTRSPW